VDVIYGVGPAVSWDEKSPEQFTCKLELMNARAREGTIVLPPLPRVDEPAFDLDRSRYARYFEQAARGVPIRMTLLDPILDLVK